MARWGGRLPHERTARAAQAGMEAGPTAQPEAGVLRGHQGEVQALDFDCEEKFLVSG